MKSILRFLGGNRKKKSQATAPTIISIKSTSDSSHASELEAKRKPQQQLLVEEEDDDHTHPMQEQSPTTTHDNPNTISSISHDGHIKQHSSRKHGFFHRTSDSNIQIQAASEAGKRSNQTLLKRRQRNNTQEEGEQQGQSSSNSSSSLVPRRLRFKSRSKGELSVDTRSGFAGLRERSASKTEQTDTDTDSPSNHANQSQTERIARAAAALDNRGNELFERGYYDKAMDAYSKALKLKRRTFHSMLEEADDLFEDKLEDDHMIDESKTDPKLLVSMATSINNIGYLRQRAGDATPDETMAAYEKSLRIKRRILGNDSLSVGKTLNNIGSVHYLKKEFPAAVSAYEEGLQVMQANLGAGHPDVATVLSNMGDVQLAQAYQEKALEHYRSALNIRWAVFGEHDPRVVRLLEKIAKVEIGDRMTPKGSRIDDQTYDWDESHLFDLDMKPLEDELHLLHNQVEEDMQYVDLLQKKMAVDMVKDKVLILKGMRELLETQEDDSHRDESQHDNNDNDEASYEETISPKPSINRDLAQQHIKDRLAKLRSQRGGEDGFAQLEGDDSLSKLDCHDSFSSLENTAPGIFSASFYTRNQRTALSSLQPDEIKGEVNSLRSALKLRKGIDSLRSFGRDAEEERQGSSRSIIACQGQA